MKKNYLDLPPELLSEMVLIFACRRMDEFDRMPGARMSFTPAELLVAAHIRTHPDITVTDLARYFGRTKGAISQLVKRLRAKELCIGTPDEVDKKKIHLKLTEKGSRLCLSRGEHVRDIMEENIREITSRVGEDAVNGYFTVIDLINSVDADGRRK